MAHQSRRLPIHQHPYRLCSSSPVFAKREPCHSRDAFAADWRQLDEELRVSSSMPKSLSWVRCRTSTPNVLHAAWKRRSSGAPDVFHCLRHFQPTTFPKCFNRFVDKEDKLRALSRERGSSIESASTDEGRKDNLNEHVLEDGEFCFLARYATPYNFVQVLEVSRTAKNALAGARVLLLDRPGNVHSIYQKRKLLTESYYDIMAAFPAVIPEGPIAIFGLGAGSVARLIHHFWSGIDMYGWELDPGVIQTARKFFDLQELEWNGDDEGNSLITHTVRERNSAGSYRPWRDEIDEMRSSIFRGDEITPRRRQGTLRVIVGDALSDEASVEGGFAGIIVDLFSRGAVVPALQQAETWREIKSKLRPHGRIIVNCGGSCVEAEGPEKKNGATTMKETTRALWDVFPQELCIKTLRNNSDNTMALTGPSPDFKVWRDILPDCLRDGVQDWRPLTI